uniref:Cytochrome P450 n=1 Tax=Oryza glumipatula TaxID=40148 RepID=A0A0E0AQV8_9ORYZ
MEDWLFYSLTSLLCLACSLLLRARASAAAAPLPPGPSTVPVLGPLLFLARRDIDVEPTLRWIAAEHGPVFTFAPLGPTIFVAARGAAYRALVQRGPAFASRPRAVSPACISSGARRCVLDALVSHVRGEGGAPVTVMEPFRYAMLCLLVHMCFGDRPGDARVRAIEAMQRDLLANFPNFEVFAFLPPITKLVFRKRWNEMVSLRRRQEELFVPLMRARREAGAGGDCYVDSLVKLTIPEDGGRGLTDGEIVSLYSEFMSAGTDTTVTVLQWILANLVKNPAMQDRLREEIAAAVGGDGEVREEDLQAMPYLKAVVLEGLRRHSPGLYALPHAVEDETTLDGYRVPANTPVNFAVREIGLDSEVWASPEVFRQERFLAGGEGEDVDLTGSKEIKMMPFGAGRRVCPGMALALLHLEYFVANLVREFDWREVAGDEVDLTEKMLEFTVAMKRPLKAIAVPLRSAATVTGSA